MEKISTSQSSNVFIDAGAVGTSGTPAARTFLSDIKTLAVFINPAKWFACVSGMDLIRKPDLTHIFYTVLGVNNAGVITPSILIAPTSITSVDLVYLRDHTDYVQNNATPGDLSGISDDGKRRILTFAEVIARRWKSTEAADVPEAMLKQMIELDVNNMKENRNG